MLFEVRGLTARFLTEGDGPGLQELFERDQEYFEATFAHPPGAEAVSTFLAVPEGKGDEDKFLIGLFKGGGRLVGVADVIRDYPSPGEMTLGIIFVDPTERGHGLGRGFFHRLQSWAAGVGATRFRAAVGVDNTSAVRFFARLGFQESERLEHVRTGARETDLVIMTKDLRASGPRRRPLNG